CAHRPLLELLPALDREVAEVIELCLQKDRDRRMRSASQLCTRLTEIARRLSTDPREIDRTPRRRATDRLPETTRAEKQATMARAGVSLPRRLFGALGIPTPSRTMVGVIAAVAGCAMGLRLGQTLNQRAPVIIQASAPAAAEAVVPATEDPRPAVVD